MTERTRTGVESPTISGDRHDGLRYPGQDAPFYLATGDGSGDSSSVFNCNTGGPYGMREDALRRTHGVATGQTARDGGVPR